MTMEHPTMESHSVTAMGSPMDSPSNQLPGTKDSTVPIHSTSKVSSSLRPVSCASFFACSFKRHRTYCPFRWGNSHHLQPTSSKQFLTEFASNLVDQASLTSSAPHSTASRTVCGRPPFVICPALAQLLRRPPIAPFSIIISPMSTPPKKQLNE